MAAVERPCRWIPLRSVAVIVNGPQRNATAPPVNYDDDDDDDDDDYIDAGPSLQQHQQQIGLNFFKASLVG